MKTLRLQEDPKSKYCTSDINAKIGKKVEDCINIGSFVIVNRNDKGEMRVYYLQNQNFCYMNTALKKPIQKK